jgi:uncharacterized protein YjhX (UPF0386 family)
MKNTKKNPDLKRLSLMVMVPLLGMFCFSVYSAQGGILHETVSISTGELKAFEGYYQLDKDKDRYLQILIKENKLVLRQLWDQREIPFEQKSALNFYNEQFSFPLSFSKDTNGEITQVLAFDRDTWIKVKNYKPVVKKEITLSSEKMKAFAGKYKMTDDGQDRFLQFTVAGNSLEVKELWSGNLFTIVPESELVFFAKNAYYPVQFSKDKDGNIIQALILKRDVWLKVKDQN